MTEFSYQQLYSFLQTAKAGSLTRAAGRLSVSQPALSLQLRQLEKSLGEKLYRRTRRGIELTEEGRVAMEHGERIFAEGDALLDSLRRRKKAAPPALRLGVSRGLLGQEALDIIAGLRGAGAGIDLRTAAPRELRRRLLAGQLDLAACEEPLAGGEGIRVRQVGETAFRFVAAPLVGKSLGRFLQEKGIVAPLLLPTSENPARLALDRYLLHFPGRWKTMAETDQWEVLRSLALQGRGAAFLPESFVRRDLADGRLARVDGEPSSTLAFGVWLACRARREADPALRPTLDHMMTRFRLGEP